MNAELNRAEIQEPVSQWLGHRDAAHAALIRELVRRVACTICTDMGDGFGPPHNPVDPTHEFHCGCGRCFGR